MRTAQQIEAEIKALQKELEEVQAAAVPEPDFDPAVIFFEKIYGRDRKYTFVAVKSGDSYSVTGNNPGRNPNPKSWPQLVDFIDMAEKNPPEIWAASELVQIR